MGVESPKVVRAEKSRPRGGAIAALDKGYLTIGAASAVALLVAGGVWNIASGLTDMRRELEGKFVTKDVVEAQTASLSQDMRAIKDAVKEVQATLARGVLPVSEERFRAAAEERRYLREQLEALKQELRTRD